MKLAYVLLLCGGLGIACESPSPVPRDAPHEEHNGDAEDGQFPPIDNTCERVPCGAYSCFGETVIEDCFDTRPMCTHYVVSTNSGPGGQTGNSEQTAEPEIIEQDGLTFLVVRNEQYVGGAGGALICSPLLK